MAGMERTTEETDQASRSVAQLRMLHALAAKLNRLSDVSEIGRAITDELSELIDYHNCRVYVLEPDGQTLLPIAFKGRLSDYEGETLEALLTKVGEGLTGHVAATKESYYSPDANLDPFAVTIPGTPDVPESMVGVPLTYGDDLVGVMVLSNLGTDRFDEQDIRLLEVLASHAAVAIENAKLFQKERDSAAASLGLLALSRALTETHDERSVLLAALQAIPGMIDCQAVRAYVRDQTSGDFVLQVADDAVVAEGEREGNIPALVAEPLVMSTEDPFVLSTEMLESLPERYRRAPISPVLVAPLRWEGSHHGVVAMVATGPSSTFSDRDLHFARGIADVTSLALGSASRFQELQEDALRLQALDEMKTTFLEAVSHELRTPLSSVLGISLTLGRDEIHMSEVERSDMLARLSANARKLERLLADLLDLDRLSRGIVEPNRRNVDVGELARAVVDGSERIGERQIVLEVEPVKIAVDAAKVERIIENLVANAVRHTPDGSPILVSVKAVDGGVQVVVEDQGPGVPDEFKHAIFEPFRQGPQTNRYAPGVGIGLSLVARFAELHGGHAWVEDRSGGGAAFKVFLPDA
jgi:K+-sensing histidine kinase KdpD